MAEIPAYLDDNYDPIDMNDPDAVHKLIDDKFSDFFSERLGQEFSSLIKTLKDVSIEKGRNTESCYAIVQRLHDGTSFYVKYYNTRKEAQDDLENKVKEYAYDRHADVQKAFATMQPIQELEKDFEYALKNMIRIGDDVHFRFSIKKVFLK